MSGSFKAALHRPVHQQIAEHSEKLIQMFMSTHQEIAWTQGVVAGLRLALEVQEDIFKHGGHE